MANQFASSSLAATLSLLKNWYAGTVVTQFNDEIPLYREMEKGREKFAGLQVVRAVKVRRNPGIGSTSDGGLLPSIGTQTTINAQIAAKYNYLRWGVTGPMMKAAQGDKATFANIVEYEMEQGMIDLKNDVNRQLHWQGDGTLATVAANVAASQVMTVSGRVSQEDGNKYLDVGMIIDIVNATTGVLSAQSLTITNVVPGATATITVDQIFSASANDIVVRKGSYNNDIQGLVTPLDAGSNNLSGTSTIFGVNRATYSVFQGNVIAGANAPLSLNLIKTGWNSGKERGGAKYNYVESDFDSEQMYEKLLIVDKRYIGKVRGDGTFSSKEESYLDYGGIPWVSDKDVPGRINIIDVKTWKKYELSALEWADESGSEFISQISSDSFEVRLRLFANVFCEKPSANVSITGYISP